MNTRNQMDRHHVNPAESIEPVSSSFPNVGYFGFPVDVPLNLLSIQEWIAHLVCMYIADHD
jgi:hypothetical protein